jgi:hypothetical protein
MVPFVKDQEKKGRSVEEPRTPGSFPIMRASANVTHNRTAMQFSTAIAASKSPSSAAEPTARALAADTGEFARTQP